MKSKIFLLHFAGGNCFSYDYLRKTSEIDFIPLELPGRGKRIKETLLSDLNEAVHDYYNQIIKLYDGKDYIIYGHSMGALLGYLVCHMIQKNNFPLPEKLIVSGKKAPSTSELENISHLPDKDFWKKIFELGGTPLEIQNYPELVEYFLPILKNDFKIIESYISSEKKKLNVPIDVFYGSEEADDTEMIGWLEETNQQVNFTKLEGDHFFIFKHKEYFKNYFLHLNKNKLDISAVFME